MIGKKLSFAAATLVALTTGAFLARPTGQATPPGPGDRSGDWIYYGGDARNWRYKPFDQINANNSAGKQAQVEWVDDVAKVGVPTQPLPQDAPRRVVQPAGLVAAQPARPGQGG